MYHDTMPRVQKAISFSLLFAAMFCLACRVTPKGMATPGASVDGAPVDATSAVSASVAQKVHASVESLLPQYQNAAVVVGVLADGTEQFFSFGKVAAQWPVAPDAHTRFEVGSVTKVFTGILLAIMVQRGEVSLDDPAQRYLPANLRLPTDGERPITLLDLATHTSGLSDLPWDMPYRRRERGEQVREEEVIGHPSGTLYTRERLAHALAKESLDRAPGSKYTYSSLGYGMLGIALTERAGKGFGPLLRERILAPLGLNETHLYPEDTRFDQRFAEGHNAQGRLSWFRKDEEALVACCGLRSSAHDLIRLLRLQLDDDGGFGTPAQLARSPQRQSGWQGGHTYLEQMGLGWHVMSRPMGRVYKFGSMSGYSAVIDVDPAARRGVVVLAAHQGFPVDMIARAVLPRPILEHEVRTEVLPSAGPAAHAVARWDAGIDLLRAELSSPQARPGERVELRLWLRVERTVDRDLTLLLHADGQAGRALIDHVPARSSRTWPVGQVIEHRVRFVLPADYPRATAQLWLGFYDGKGRVPLSVGDGDGTERARVAALDVQGSASRF